MFDMLAGATIAMVAAARPQPGPRARMALHVAAPVCAVALGVFWVTAGTATRAARGRGCSRAGSSSAPCWRPWWWPMSASSTRDRWPRCSRSARCAGSGSISYGIYLWHWPIFVFFTQARTGLGEPWLDLARVALTLVVATASYYLVERAFRRRLLVGGPASPWPRRWRP